MAACLDDDATRVMPSAGQVNHHRRGIVIDRRAGPPFTPRVWSIDVLPRCTAKPASGRGFALPRVTFGVDQVAREILVTRSAGLERCTRRHGWRRGREERRYSGDRRWDMTKKPPASARLHDHRRRPPFDANAAFTARSATYRRSKAREWTSRLDHARGRRATRAARIWSHTDWAKHDQPNGAPPLQETRGA